MSGTLYIVATPIGNLGDFTTRARDTLSQVSTIFCEDTRVTDKLCKAFGISSKLVSCHHHNEASRKQELLSLLADGKNVAYVSDAGTPGVSDPGGRLVSIARDAKYEVVAVPGPSAITAALSISGLSETGFIFLGFLPSKSGQRESLIKKHLVGSPWIFYESPHRIQNTLTDLSLLLAPEDKVFIFREMTKKFEESWVGTVSLLKSEIEKIKTKGEFVVIVAPKKNEIDEDELSEKQLVLLRRLLSVFSVKDAASILSQHESLSKKKVYEQALKIKNEMK